MKKLLLILLVIICAWLPYFMGAWDNDIPADSTAWNDASALIRDNWDHFETQFGTDITGNIKVVSVELTNAQIKDLADTPVELVPGLGKQRVIEFAGAVLALDYGSNALVESADNLVIEYDSGSGPAVSEVIETTGFIDQTADTITFAIPVKDAIGASSTVVNKNLVLSNNAGDFTGNAAADTTMTVLVSYRTKNLFENVIFNGENLIYNGEQVVYP